MITKTQNKEIELMKIRNGLLEKLELLQKNNKCLKKIMFYVNEKGKKKRVLFTSRR